jgi:hypothetical protein
MKLPKLTRKRGLIAGALLLLAAAIGLSSCAALQNFGASLNRALQGVPATMYTYTQQGALVDKVTGNSFSIERDDRFDTTDSEGASKKDSQVLMISLADGHISHVGSTLVLAQDGITQVAGAATQLKFTNNQSGTPWLNDAIEKHRNLWQGKTKTIMVRSQDGTPIAVYAGNTVEVFATDVPQSTAFRVDGKLLYVYRADISTVDNHLIH